MTYQDTNQAPCTIFQGPWKWQRGWAGAEPPHSVVCHIYGGPKMILVHGEPWSYGHRWNDPTLFEELAEMIRQAPEVRKERDELKDIQARILKAREWKPIASLRRDVMQFVLVFQDGAQRLHLWNDRAQRWETGKPGQLVGKYDECGDPTHFMELPDSPEQ